MKIALATCARLPDMSDSDKKLIPEFSKYKIEAVPAIWDDPENIWESYDAVIIRNTWDYYTKFPLFIKWLDTLEATGIKVLNDLKIIRKNSHKFYLKEIIEIGFRVIPTIFLNSNSKISDDDLLKYQKMVLKPAVSAGSYKTEILTRKDLNSENIRSKTSDGDWLLQPFLPEIQTEGEISMIFFGNEYSHAIIKRPTDGDFRVQKQFGGIYLPYLPSQELLDELNPVFKIFGDEFLFGRIDGVKLGGKFHIMEIEMLEPDLYFDFFPEKVALFCEKAVEMIKF
ncbi:MAG: hypothetical protein LCH67_16270 [Bacteroidetes bacterium]|nr:hypothetical protein [Bacteroidota bacterium]